MPAVAAAAFEQQLSVALAAIMHRKRTKKKKINK